MDEPTTPAPVAELRMLLDAAGLPASDAEVAALARQYPAMRAGVDALYAPAAVRYVDPALGFTAGATIVDWS
ncbi:MAG TPA: hypothetical protein VGM60_22230 [Pseudonocardia sp.]|jgi:hypothetical protein|uniref:hypothetical protein n=1 Tax=Pseudonocardia sp. TaxID=60912 RepID=UPI002F41DEBE